MSRTVEARRAPAKRLVRRTVAQATAAWIASRYDRPRGEEIVFAVLAGAAAAIAGLLIAFAGR